MSKIEEILTAKEYLKELGVDDRILNPSDLVEFQKRTSKLMEEYAKERTLAFTKWKDENYRYEDGFYFLYIPSESITKTDVTYIIEQLFDEWNNLKTT